MIRKVALAHLIDFTGIVSVYHVQRERFVKLFSALKLCCLDRLVFFPVQIYYEMAPFSSISSVSPFFSVLCPFLSEGLLLAGKKHYFPIFPQVTDRERGRGKKKSSFLFFTFQPSIILYALKNLIA